MTGRRLLSIAAMINSVFHSMRIQGGEIAARRMADKVKESNQHGGDPYRKFREELRRGVNARGKQTNYINGPGKQQGERIARQIAKGQLRRENGLEYEGSIPEGRRKFLESYDPSLEK